MLHGAGPTGKNKRQERNGPWWVTRRLRQGAVAACQKYFLDHIITLGAEFQPHRASLEPTILQATVSTRGSRYLSDEVALALDSSRYYLRQGERLPECTADRRV